MYSYCVDRPSTQLYDLVILRLWNLRPLIRQWNRRPLASWALPKRVLWILCCQKIWPVLVHLLEFRCRILAHLWNNRYMKFYLFYVNICHFSIWRISDLRSGNRQIWPETLGVWSSLDLYLSGVQVCYIDNFSWTKIIGQGCPGT